jgi:hypothetical protein
MNHAFLSYGREDLAIAERLHLALRAAGKIGWRDLGELAGGEAFWKRIEDAIAGSHYFVLIMSPASLGSANCRRELDFALQCQKRILPMDFRVERTSQVWEPIESVQWWLDGFPTKRRCCFLRVPVRLRQTCL